MSIKFYVLDELDIVNAFVCRAVSKRAPIQYLGSDVDDDIIEECKRNTGKVLCIRASDPAFNLN
jgi:hypothetical protein